MTSVGRVDQYLTISVNPESRSVVIIIFPKSIFTFQNLQKNQISSQVMVSLADIIDNILF